MRKNNIVLAQYRNLEEEKEINVSFHKNFGDDPEDARIYYIPLGAPEYKAKVMITADKDWEHLSISIAKSKYGPARRPTDDEVEFLRAMLFEENEIVLLSNPPDDTAAMVEGVPVNKNTMICAHLYSPVNKSWSERETIKQFFSQGNGR